jgi:signal transduction histidine kinase
MTPPSKRPTSGGADRAPATSAPEHAIRSGAAAIPVRARLETGTIRRYPPEVEATVYFCCLEALQNAGKHAGSDVHATVGMWEEEDGSSSR